MSHGERVDSPEGPLATSGTTADEWVRPPEVDSGRRSGPVGGGEPRLSAHLFFCPARRARTRLAGTKKIRSTPRSADRLAMPNEHWTSPKSSSKKNGLTHARPPSAARRDWD